MTTATATAPKTSKVSASDRELFKGSAAEVSHWMSNEEILSSIGCNFNVDSFVPSVDGREYPECRLWLRSDNGDHLGTFGNRRKAIQPVDFVKYFRDFCDKSGKAISLDVVGTPDNGKTFYMASKLIDNDLQGLMEQHKGKGFGINRDLDKDDRTDAWLIVTDYYGESSAPKAIVYFNELVCANGATRRTESKLVGLSHLRQQNANNVSNVILSAIEQVDIYSKIKDKLIQTKITSDFARNCITAFYRSSEKPDGTACKKVDRLVEIYENRLIGGELATRQGTAWGLYQAVTQNTTHGHIGDGGDSAGRAFKSLIDGPRARESRSFVDFLQFQLAGV